MSEQGNSVIGFRIGLADLRSEERIKTGLAGCASCQSIGNAGGPPTLNIATCDVNVTITMSISKGWNSQSPWRKVWNKGFSYKTTGAIVGGLKKGIAPNTGGLTPEFPTAVQQLKDWFQANSEGGESLDDGAAEDIIKQLYQQAVEKQEKIFATIKKTMDSSTTGSGANGYLPHAHNGFNEAFRELADTTDWDAMGGTTVRTVPVKVNIAITPTISNFCKDDTGKGEIETKDSTFCGYFNTEWSDTGAWQIYINDYAEPPKDDVNSDYFTNTSWTRYDKVFETAGSWNGTPLRSNIYNTALLSSNNPGVLYFVNGGFEANINGNLRAKIITDLSEDPQTRMTATISLAIGGGVGSNYYSRPFIEQTNLIFNLGSPESMPANISALRDTFNLMVSGPSIQYQDMGGVIDNVISAVANTVSNTVGNLVDGLIGQGSSTPNRIGDGTVNNPSSQGSTDLRANGAQSEAPNPRAR
jgi:hypothetical protein